MDVRIGVEFQRATKYTRAGMSVAGYRPSRPERYKLYPERPKTALPEPLPPQTTLHDTLRNRKSIRGYAPQPLSLDQLSYLLWASAGIQRTEDGYEFRTAPSAGALYPIETYIVANNVEGIERGLYHYDIRGHSLEQLRTGDVRAETVTAALGQEMCGEAPVVFIWTAMFDRCASKYSERAYRYVYLDVGHIAENLALAAVAFDLGTCQIGALFDDEVNAIVGADGESESALYMSVVGVEG